MKLTPLNRPLELFGTGFPEGKVLAPVGSIYTDRQATAGAVRWIKTSGTGTTGWQVQYGDTGWRDITSLADPDKWDNVTAQLNYIKMRRIGDFVHFEVRLKRLANGSTAVTSNGIMTRIPVGFRASYYGVKGLGIISGDLADFRASSGLVLGVTTTKGGRDWEVGESALGTFVISTMDAWPTTLPGIPS